MSVTSIKPQSIVYFAFSIRDIKTNTFNIPYFQTHKAGAMRMFSDLCRDQNTPMSKHAEDFQLYEIGVFDSETGMVAPHDQPQFLSNATDFQS